MAEPPAIRVLLLADTHIGLDLPVRPLVQRRRRGQDFLANFDRALAPAHSPDEGIDLVVHGGDLLDRSRPPAAVLDAALAPLLRAAEAGMPVVLVPGNHERSRIPRTLRTCHPKLLVLDRPCTLPLDLRGHRVAVSGFPFARDGGARFPDLLEDTGWWNVPAAVRLLCLHQAVEGATVGPVNFTFRRGMDVVPGRAIPPGFAAILSGHIHRAQTLTTDLAGRPMAAPVIYPGSVERTAFAERFEDKSFVVLDIEVGQRPGGSLACIDRRPLPARPMVAIDLAPTYGPALSHGALAALLAELDPNAVVRLRLPAGHHAPAGLDAATLRRLVPATMNVDVVMSGAAGPGSASFRPGSRPSATPGSAGTAPARSHRPPPRR